MESLAYICDIERIAAITRAATYLVSCMGGILCIYLGYKLYAQGVKSAVGGNLKNKGWSIALRASGPGVFLSFFGMSILVYALSNPVVFRAEISERVETPTKSLPAPTVLADPRDHALPDPSGKVKPLPAAPAPTPSPVRSERVEISFFDGGPLTKPRVAAASVEALGLLQAAMQRPDISDKDLRRLQHASETLTALKEETE